MIIYKFKKSLIVLLYPQYWFTDSECIYNAEFDKWINIKLNDGELPKRINDCKVSFAGRTFWHYVDCSRQWHLYERGFDKVRPARTTQARLEHALNKNRVVKSKWRKDEKY